MTYEEEHGRSTENADLIRRAYRAYANGDLATMLEFVNPDLEWTYLDPTLEHPPRRSATAATSWSDAHHGRHGDDRAYSVFRVRDGRIVALRDCRDREEARRLAGIQS
jgi:ketosteroid isomerase-like protein